MSHDARGVANYIINIAFSKNISITNLALNKVLFFCHAHFLISFDKPLIQQEFEAWQFGPVVADIYHSFKESKNTPIKELATKIDFKTGNIELAECNFNKEEKELIHNCAEFYLKFPVNKLVEISHIEDGPWDKAWNHDKLANPGMIIQDVAIKNYFHTPWLQKGGLIGRA